MITPKILKWLLKDPWYKFTVKTGKTEIEKGITHKKNDTIRTLYTYETDYSEKHTEKEESKILKEKSGDPFNFLSIQRKNIEKKKNLKYNRRIIRVERNTQIDGGPNWVYTNKQDITGKLSYSISKWTTNWRGGYVIVYRVWVIQNL